MNKILFYLAGDENIAINLAKDLNLPIGEYKLKKFADGESFLQIKSEVKDKEVVVLSSLDHPDDKIIPLLFFARTAKEFGAKSVGLLAPYLAYMRQDKRFHEGEAITSACFADLISAHFSWLITIDPHLHRYNSLSEIYAIKSQAIHATNVIGDWIKNNISDPILVGPDEESLQWVESIAKNFNMPFLVLKKERFDDRHVKVSIPNFDKYQKCNPILVDDIISTGHTMVETCKHIIKQGMKKPICIGVHGIFVDNAYDELKKVSQDVITCNTIVHFTNKIDITSLLKDALEKM